MDVSIVELASIRPYERNPRLNDAAVDAVTKSLQEFGFRQPIVVDADGVIVCGHTRWKAVTKLGLARVPVHVAQDLSPEQLRAYRIADNQTASIAEWDFEILPIELKELQADGFDLGLLGFAPDDLQSSHAPAESTGQTDPDDIPAPPDNAITQPGDIWILGDHRLMCGDSSSSSDLDRLLDGAVIHLVNMDLPYNVKVEPRSNNAIAAGLSSFAGAMHHELLDAGQRDAREWGQPRSDGWPSD